VPVRYFEQNVGGTGSVSVVHTYEKAGTYRASVRVKDNDGRWSDILENCKVQITVTGQVLGVTAPPVNPKTGFSVTSLGLLGILGVIISAAVLLI